MRSPPFIMDKYRSCHPEGASGPDREEMEEEQRRRENEEARNLQAAHDMARMSLNTPSPPPAAPSAAAPPPLPPHHAPHGHHYQAPPPPPGGSYPPAYGVCTHLPPLLHPADT